MKMLVIMKEGRLVHESELVYEREMVQSVRKGMTWGWDSRVDGK